MLDANTKLAWRPAWQSLLANGTVNNPVQNNLTGIVYGAYLFDTHSVERFRSFMPGRSCTGDYFFIKAGNELVSRGFARC